MPLRRREPLDIALATIKGETEPAEPFVLERDRVVTIGRTGTIRLLDQLVSIHHARVLFDEHRERYLIEDLGSATGTFVNGECVRGETRDLKLGMELRFGETTMRVERVARFGWVIPAIGAIAGVMVLVALVFTAVYAFMPAPAAEPLYWEDTVLTPQGRKTTIPIPDAFRWQRGLALPLRLVAVSDHDLSGVDEMWIVDGRKEHLTVVTFDPTGEWIELGSLPGDCVVRSEKQAFPVVDCKGEQWEMMTDEGEAPPGHYRPVFHEGPVVWYREVAAKPPPPKKVKGKPGLVKAPAPAPGAPGSAPGFGTLPKDGPLLVGRFALKDEEQFKAFLVERGVFDKVHYLICEGTFEGIRAQALTDRGAMAELGVGCIEELRLEGQISGRPFAVAFTPAGLRALVDDVLTFYGGSPDGMFLDSEWRTVEDALRADPGHFRGAVKLVTSTQKAIPEVFPPFPPLETPAPGLHPMVGVDQMLVAARPATTVTLPGPGIHQYATSGCETLRVEVNSYDAPAWFSTRGTLISVTEVGCGDPRDVMSAGYEPGRRWGEVGALEVALDVELEPVATSGDVLRVRLSWR